MIKHYIECACGDVEHILRVVEDPDDSVMYVETCLSDHHSFLQRLWIAIKHVFGHKSKYGMFECTLLDPEQQEELVKIITQHKQKHKK